MRRLIALFVVLAMSGAFAQGRFFGEVASAGLSIVPGFGLSAQVRAGAEDVLGPLALRGEIGFNSGGGFGIGADVLYFLRQPGQSLEFYFGGGLNVQSSSGGAVFGLGGAAGLEIPVNRDFTFFVEAQPQIFFGGGGSAFFLGVQFGPRLYFR